MNNAFENQSLSYDVIERKLNDMCYWLERISTSLIAQGRYMEAETTLRIRNELQAARSM